MKRSTNTYTKFAYLGGLLAVFVLIVTCGDRSGSQSPESSIIAERLNNSPRHQEWVLIDTPHGTKLEAFIVFPEVETPALSVIVIHENRGLTDWVRSVADQLAEKGYIAICPDLLSGKGPAQGGTQSFASGDDLRRALSQLTENEITENLLSTVNYVRGLPAASEKVAVAGFCWGGRNTFNFAAQAGDAHLSAAFVFYGTPPDRDAMESIQCQVYGFYGGNDNRVSSTVEATVQAMSELNNTYEPVIYPGAGHGFMRSGEEPDASQENKDAYDKGWERFLSLLRTL